MPIPDWKTSTGYTWSEAVTYTDGVYVPSSIEIAEPSQAPSGLPDAVLVDVAGNIVGQLSCDTVDQTYAVQAGISPLRFKSITQASTHAFGAFRVLRVSAP